MAFAVIIHEKGGQPRRQEFFKSEITIGPRSLVRKLFPRFSFPSIPCTGGKGRWFCINAV